MQEIVFPESGLGNGSGVGSGVGSGIGAERAAYREPKQSRGRRKFTDILDYGEILLTRDASSNFTLNDIAEGLDIALGSVYHFFPSREALLLAIADRILEQFSSIPTLAAQSLAPKATWQEFWRDIADVARERFLGSPAARNLLLGRACSWDIRLADAWGQKRIAVSITDHMGDIFDFSFCDDLERHILNGVIINDAFWRMSMRETGTLTPNYFELSIEAALAYFRQYFPPNLRRLKPKSPESSGLS